MFKSVFTKYITAFMLIITLSFLLLAVLLCQMVNGYSVDAKADLVERTADIATNYITNDYKEEDNYDFSQYVYFSRGRLEPFISGIAGLNDDIIIFITDASGAILLTDTNVSQDYLSRNVPQDIISKISSDGEQTFSGDLGGVFSSKHLVHVVPFYDSSDGFVGSIFVCSPSKGIDQLIETMVKTVIMSCLWVMLAALLAVYFISEKIIDPLKQMSNAAKKFAAGKPWLHLDIAGTADNSGFVWQHQVPGATGTAVSTLYHLAKVLFEEDRA